jgi:hypothetical protein
VTDLHAKLDDMTRQATGRAGPPDPEAVVRRGRRRRRRQLAAATALAAIAVVVSVPIARDALTTAAPDPVAPAGRRGGAAVAALGPWFGRADASVFLSADVTQAQRDALRARLDGLPIVDTVWYESRTESFAAFREQFRDAPELAEGVRVEAMPESFRVRLNRPESFPALRLALCRGGRCADGVDQVIDLLGPLRQGQVERALRADVTVILRDDVTPEELTALRDRAERVDGVAEVVYEPPVPGSKRSAPRASAPVLGPYPDLGGPAALRVRLAARGDPDAFTDALCRTRRTGNCAAGVAVVIAHPEDLVGAPTASMPPGG